MSGAGKRARQPASGSRRLADVPHPEDLNFPAALWAHGNREAINRDTQEPVPHAPCVIIMVSVELRERRERPHSHAVVVSCLARRLPSLPASYR
jgi:hypothetical protein